MPTDDCAKKCIPRTLLRRHHMVWCLQLRQANSSWEKDWKGTGTYHYIILHTNIENSNRWLKIQNQRSIKIALYNRPKNGSEFRWPPMKQLFDKICNGHHLPSPALLRLVLIWLVLLVLLVLVLIRIKVLVGAQESWPLRFFVTTWPRLYHNTPSSQTEEAVVHANAIACTNSLSTLAHLKARNIFTEKTRHWGHPHVLYYNVLYDMLLYGQRSNKVHWKWHWSWQSASRRIAYDGISDAWPSLVPARPFHRRGWTCRRISFRHGLALQVRPGLHGCFKHKLIKEYTWPLNTTLAGWSPNKHWTDNEQSYLSRADYAQVPCLHAPIIGRGIPPIWMQLDCLERQHQKTKHAQALLQLKDNGSFWNSISTLFMILYIIYIYIHREIIINFHCSELHQCPVIARSPPRAHLQQLSGFVEQLGVEAETGRLVRTGWRESSNICPKKTSNFR